VHWSSLFAGLYVLSIGPAAWFVLPPPGIPYCTLFAPLDYTGETCEPIGVWLEWYVSSGYEYDLTGQRKQQPLRLLNPLTT
jgi:hypothetical protein